MATILSGNQIRLNDGKIVTGEQGGWYDGQQLWNGSLSNAGQIHTQSNQIGAGQQVSTDVIAQTNPANVAYIQANQLKSPVSIPTTTGNSNMSGLLDQVDQARKALEGTLAQQKAENDAKMAELRKTEKETLAKVEQVTTPFREDLEKSERERLYVNENFEANQKLVNELDALLTEGNALIKQQSEVTGLASVRNPRIQKTMTDVAARVGVIEAVMNARNGQIAQAYTMIDRTIGAIAQDRQDQLTYYSTILNLTNRDILSLDADSKRIAQEQVNLLKFDLDNAQKTADYIKELMINPATAQLMGDAGVTLNDSVETINTKLRQAQYFREVTDFSNKMSLEGYRAINSPSGVPADQLVTIKDSQGKTYYFRKNVSASSSPADLAAAYGFKLSSGAINADQKSGTISINTDLMWDEVFRYSSPTTLGGTPNFVPAGGIGTVYKNEYGTWKYTSSGWVGSSSNSSTVAKSTVNQSISLPSSGPTPTPTGR